MEKYILIQKLEFQYQVDSCRQLIRDGSLPIFGSNAIKWKDDLPLVRGSKILFVNFGPIIHPHFSAWCLWQSCESWTLFAAFGLW